MEDEAHFNFPFSVYSVCHCVRPAQTFVSLSFQLGPVRLKASPLFNCLRKRFNFQHDDRMFTQCVLLWLTCCHGQVKTTRLKNGRFFWLFWNVSTDRGLWHFPIHERNMQSINWNSNSHNGSKRRLCRGTQTDVARGRVENVLWNTFVSGCCLRTCVTMQAEREHSSVCVPALHFMLYLDTWVFRCRADDTVVSCLPRLPCPDSHKSR